MIIIDDDWSYTPSITTSTSTNINTKDKNDIGIIYVPLIKITPLYDEIYARPQFDPCRNCNNNPRNNSHASGICHCALPSMHNPIY